MLVSDALAGGAECRVDDALPRTANVSIMARIARQFAAPDELVTPEKVVELPAMPTMGARLDLRREGVETPLEVIRLKIRPEADGPPEADLFLVYAALTTAPLCDWQTSEPRVDLLMPDPAQPQESRTAESAPEGSADRVRPGRRARGVNWV